MGRTVQFVIGTQSPISHPIAIDRLTLTTPYLLAGRSAVGGTPPPLPAMASVRLCLPSALGEEGVWDERCNPSSTRLRASAIQSPSTDSPLLPLPVGGKVGCWRDAPSSPRDGIGSSVLPSALGEEGVWDERCNSLSAPNHPSAPNRHRQTPLSQPNQQPPPAIATAGRGGAEGVGVRATRMVGGAVTNQMLRHPRNRDRRLTYSRTPSIRGQPPNRHRQTPLSQPDQQPHPPSPRLGEGDAAGVGVRAAPRRP